MVACKNARQISKVKRRDKELSVVKKYMSKYAEPIVQNLSAMPGQYSNVVVIPAFNEDPEFLLQKELVGSGQNLIILVVNLPDDCEDQDAITKTQQLISYIQKEMILIWEESGSATALYRNDLVGYSLLLIDRAAVGRRIPRKMGVGLARKIGSDIAAMLIDLGVVKSKLIFSTDADAELPRGYFDADDSISGGYVFPFRHQVKDQSLMLPMQLYEFSLHYYVAGLKYAGSNYAFHTIGSCLAINYLAYVKVRGFPKRAAGEDFYLLNKVVKVGEIKKLSGKVVSIAGRPSDRVPFGTGPAISKISCMKAPLLEYKYYNPRVFECLRLFLNSLEDDWQDSQLDINIKFGDYREQISSAIDAMGFQEAKKSLRQQSKTLEQFLRKCTEWFDAFRTLKFIHFLRDNYFPSVYVGELYSCDLVSELINQYPALFGND